jgi:hypothetical protein
MRYVCYYCIYYLTGNDVCYTQDRPVIIPGHGQHLTGLGHVQDLAVAMANVLGKDVSFNHDNTMHL